MRTLREVKPVAAEDTCRTRKLLSHYGIKIRLISYHEYNKETGQHQLLAALRQHDVALVCNASVPGISDPGYKLVRSAIEENHRVMPAPGPSALVSALTISGLPADQFIHLGFLPRKKGARKRLLASLAKEPLTIVTFDAPHRLLASLQDIPQPLGDRPLAFARELTKLPEEAVRGRHRSSLSPTSPTGYSRRVHPDHRPREAGNHTKA